MSHRRQTDELRFAPEGRGTVAPGKSGPKGGTPPGVHVPRMRCALEGRRNLARPSCGRVPPPFQGGWIHEDIRGPGARAGAQPPATVQRPSRTTGA
jgi:hypothetical protein